MSTSKAEANAREFAQWETQGGWRFALLVACSVEKGKGQGGRSDLVATTTKLDEKLSSKAFAKTANTSADRVLRFLKAWDTVAATGKLTPSVNLTPNDVDTYQFPADLPDWDGEDGVYVGENRTGTGLKNRRITDNNVKEAIKANPSIVAEAVKEDPKVADAAWEAIEEKGIERANNAALAAIQRGGKVTQPEKTQLGSAWAAAKSAASRGEALQALEDAIDVLEAAAKLVRDNGSPLDNEGEQIEVLNNRIIDVAAQLSSLSMEVAR